MRVYFNLILFMLEVNTALTKFPNFWVTYLCTRFVNKTSSYKNYFKITPHDFCLKTQIYILHFHREMWFHFYGGIDSNEKYDSVTYVISCRGHSSLLNMDPACTLLNLVFSVCLSPHPSLRWAIDCVCLSDRRMQAKTWRSSCGRCPVWTSSWVSYTRNTGKCTSASCGKEAGSKTQVSQAPIRGQKTL